MVLYSSNLVLTSGRLVCIVDSMVLYSSNHVLTGGRMVCTVDSMVLYSPNLVLTRPRRIPLPEGTLQLPFFTRAPWAVALLG